MTILINEDKQQNKLINRNRNKLHKDDPNRTVIVKIQGNNVIITKAISDENPYDQLKESMREEFWYWDSSYDY